MARGLLRKGEPGKLGASVDGSIAYHSHLSAVCSSRKTGGSSRIGSDPTGFGAAKSRRR